MSKVFVFDHAGLRFTCKEKPAPEYSCIGCAFNKPNERHACIPGTALKGVHCSRDNIIFKIKHVVYA